jgi:hypothetical protein
MRLYLLAVVLLAGTAASVRADEPVAAAAAKPPAACQMPNNRILGPRSADRPLPLLAGDPQHGFHAACAVPWSTLSPRNEGLPVLECFQGSLLRLDNSSACGVTTGPLWVGSRWVLTSADLNRTANRAATCQQLETGAWAGTRDLNLDCIPQKKGPDAKPAAAAPAPVAGTPPPSTAH